MHESVRSVVRSRRDWVVIWAAVMVVTYTFGDFASTVLAMHAGGYEMNPLPRFILRNLGVGWFLVAKLVEGVFLVGVCWWLDADPVPAWVSRGRDWVGTVVSWTPFGVAAAYAFFGLSLTVNNVLVYQSLAAT